MRCKESLLHLKMCLFNCADFQMPPSRSESTCNPWDPTTPFVEKPTPLAGKGASRCYRHVNCYDHVFCFLGFCLHIPSLWSALPVLLVCLLLLSHWCISLNPLFLCVPVLRKSLPCQMMYKRIWGCWLLEQGPLMDGHCAKSCLERDIFENWGCPPSPKGVRHINKSQSQLLNSNSGSQWEEEMVSVKNWP